MDSSTTKAICSDVPCRQRISSDSPELSRRVAVRSGYTGPSIGRTHKRLYKSVIPWNRCCLALYRNGRCAFSGNLLNRAAFPLGFLLVKEFNSLSCYATCLLYTSPSPRDGLLS